MAVIEGMLFPARYLAAEHTLAQERRMDAADREWERWLDEHAWLLDLPEAHGVPA